MSKYILNSDNIIALCVMIFLGIIVFMNSIFINYEIYHLVSACILSILLFYVTWIIKNLLKLPSRSERKFVNILLVQIVNNQLTIFLVLVLLSMPIMMLFEGIFMDMMSVNPSNSNQFIMAIISIAFAGLVKILDGTFQTRRYMLASAMLFIFSAVLFFVVGLLASNAFQHTAQYQYIMIVFFAAASTSFAISIVILLWSLIKMFHQQTS